MHASSPSPPSLNIQHSSHDSSTTGSGTLADPTSSLRTAALMTRKSKRRHPNYSLSHRPASNDTFVRLDYGQAPETAPVANSDISASITPASFPSVPSPKNLEIEDGQAREEGEISDTEGASHVTIHLPSHPETNLPPSGTNLSSTKPEPSRPPLAESPSLPSQEKTKDCHSESLPPSTIRYHDFSAIEPSSNIIDIDHVRPGLTSAQLFLLGICIY